MGGSLPRLSKLYERHRQRRDRFEILAVHHAEGVQTLADLDGKLASVVEEVWEGRPLPFPILVDGTGETFEKYQISAIPRLVLIGPDGRLLENGEESVEVLEKALAEE